MAKRILLLPGLGDVHWVFLKLQAWLASKGPEWQQPEIHVWNIDNRPRTLEYLPLVPWVKAGGYFDLDFKQERVAFNSLYMTKHESDVIYDFHGFDAFIGLNGSMRTGKPFKDVLEGAAINYGYGPVNVPDNYGEHQAKLGPYFVMAFSGFGMFEKAWCTRVTADKVQRISKHLAHVYPKHRRVFTGLAWDSEWSKRCLGPNDECLVSKTTLPQFISLLRHASGYVGWCGGNSIMAQHLGTPTVVWWSRRYFPKHDRVGWETPGKNGLSNQLVLEVEDFHLPVTMKKIDKFMRERHG